MTFQLRIPRSESRNCCETTRHNTLAEVSAHYSKVRDDSGEGSSTFPDGKVIGKGVEYRVSYNGKIWTKGPWETADRVYP